MAIAESIVTGGVVAVAIGAIEVAKLSIAKRNHKHGHSEGKDILIKVTENGTKIDENNSVMKDLLNEIKAQGKTLVEIRGFAETAARKGGI